MRLQTEKISSPESAIQNHIQNIILSEVNLASNLNLQGIPTENSEWVTTVEQLIPKETMDY